MLNGVKKLNCNNNQLTFLPPLNTNLNELSCHNNKLTFLPALNESLNYVNCSNNKLTFLPSYNYESIYINFSGNPINKIIGNKLDINKWNHFREFYFLSKLRKKLISWMWKSRENKIKEQFHPKHLVSYLEQNNVSEDDGETLENFIKQW